MRIPSGDGADQRSTRRRDGAAGQGSSGASATGSSSRAGASARDAGGTGSSVFAPGYDPNRSGNDRIPASGAGGRSPSSWYGSMAGAAGKGPVRGYPPMPGQPPPMYPPGQFAAWNRGQDSRARPAAPPALPGRGQPGRGDSGQSRAGGGQLDRSQQEQAAWQSPPPETAAAGATSRYYERRDSPEAEPGYSMLAVSDPAADVTSTQTWQAVGDGRATGIWTAPAMPGAGPSRPAVPPARQSPEPAGPAAEPAHPDAKPGNLAVSGTAALRTAASRADTAEPGTAEPDTAGPGAAGAGTAGPDGTRPRGRGHSGAHSGPHATAGTDRSPRSEPASGRRAAGQSRSRRPAGRQSRRKRPASVKLAVTVALLFVVVAAATLAYTVLRSPAKPKPSAAPPSAPKVTPSSSASPSLGPFGLIGTRTSDPQPLTTAQLFPASFTAAGKTVALTTTALGSKCARGLDGASIQSAVSAAGCDQVARATYLSAAQGMMGTIGVLNLSTASGATKAARSADATDFISQLPAKHGLTRKIGAGTGIEEAAAKGHYLILIWAQFTSLHKPRTAAQRTEIENFMLALLQNTANVSLSTRMLTGSP